MVSIINIKLHTVPCKVPCVLHYILHTVHDDFRAHRNKRICSIHSDGMVCCRIYTTGRWTSRPHSTTDGAVTISAGNYLPQRFPYPHSPCFRYGFSCTLDGDSILLAKDFFDFILYLFVSKLSIFCCKIGYQMIRIMGYFIHLITVLIISRMSGFHAVDLGIECIFQSLVGIFHCINVTIRTGIGCPDHCSCTSLQKCRTT